MAKQKTALPWFGWDTTEAPSDGEVVAYFLQSINLGDSLLKYKNWTPPSLDARTKEGLQAIARRKNKYGTVMAFLLDFWRDERLFRAGLETLKALELEGQTPAQRGRGRPPQAPRIPSAGERLALAWEEEQPKKRALAQILRAFAEDDFDGLGRCLRVIADQYRTGSPAELRVAGRLERQVLPIIHAWENPMRFMRGEARLFDGQGPRPLLLGRPEGLLSPLPALIRWGTWALWSDAYRAPIRRRLSEDPEGYARVAAALGEGSLIIDPLVWQQLDTMSVKDQRAVIAETGVRYDAKGGRPRGSKDSVPRKDMGSALELIEAIRHLVDANLRQELTPSQAMALVTIVKNAKLGSEVRKELGSMERGAQRFAIRLVKRKFGLGLSESALKKRLQKLRKNSLTN